MNQNCLSRMKRSARMGTYSLVLGAIVLAVLVLVNLLAGMLPAKVTYFDVSGIGLTEISDESAKFASGIQEDVTIYWLCQGGIVDDQFDLMLTRYVEAGKHIRVEVIDTTENPTFTEDYTDAVLSDYSMIVESDRRFTTVDTADMYYYTNDFVNQYLYSGTVVPMTVQQFQELYAYCLQYNQIDISQYPTHIHFRGEALLTAALDYVTRDYIPHGYLITGHGETAPSETLSELMTSMGLEAEPLDLTVAQSVPADANCLILFSPESDLTAHETALVKDYLNGGGSLMLNTSPEVVQSCPNIQSLCALFGLTAAPGLVEEGDTSFIAGSRFTLVPTVSTEHAATSYVSSNGIKAQMPTSHAISIASALPAGVTVTPLLTTSETANRVAVDDPSMTLGVAGRLHVAVAATKSIGLPDGTTETAHLTWYGSAAAMTDASAANTSGGNYYYYAATLSSMSEGFTSAYESLAAVDLSGQALGMGDGPAFLLGAIVVLVIPVGLLTAGIVIWVRRKRR